jgi:hypothetical protein
MLFVVKAILILEIQLPCPTYKFQADQKDKAIKFKMSNKIPIFYEVVNKEHIDVNGKINFPESFQLIKGH